MPCPPLALRNALYTAVAAQAASPGYSVTGLQVVKSQRPLLNLKDLENAPRITCIALGGTRQRLDRGKRHTVEQPVFLALQAAVDADDVEAVDAFIELTDELMGTIQSLTTAGFAWQSTESLQDENGIAYDYTRLREQGEFHAYLIGRFLHTPATS